MSLQTASLLLSSLGMTSFPTYQAACVGPSWCWLLGHPSSWFPPDLPGHLPSQTPLHLLCGCEQPLCPSTSLPGHSLPAFLTRRLWFRGLSSELHELVLLLIYNMFCYFFLNCLPPEPAHKMRTMSALLILRPTTVHRARSCQAVLATEFPKS